MSLTNSYRTPGPVDYEISCMVDGKKHIWRGTAEMDVNVSADYEDIYYDSLSPVCSVKTSSETIITLRAISERPTPVKKVTTTRKIRVEDYSFASVSAARKQVGAPKTATFQFKDKYSEDQLSSSFTVKEIVFEWDEVL